MFLDGDLRAQIAFFKDKGELVPENYIRWYLNEIMSGLNYAHERDIFHSDMKPENVLVSENGWLKLGDLGICKVLVTTSG